MLNKLKKAALVIAIAVSFIAIFSILGIIPAQYIDPVCNVAGGVGLIYVGWMLWICLFDPIKRDWMIVRGWFVAQIVAFVIYIPFVATFIIHHTDNSFSSYNITYDELLYPHEERVGDDGKMEIASTLDAKPLKQQETPNLIWSVYFHYIDPGNQNMAISPKGRTGAAIMAILGIFLLNGLLISTLTSYFDRRKERWTKGEARYDFFFARRKHYIVIGGTEVAMGVVAQIFKQHSNNGMAIPYILVQTSRNVEEFRQELFSTLNNDEQKHTIIYYGNRTSLEDIKSLKPYRAEEVYIISEKSRESRDEGDGETYHDTYNMRALEHISSIYSAARKDNNKERQKLKCRVMFEYQTSFSIYQFADISSHIKSFIDFVPFNIYEMWAQRVLVNRNTHIVARSQYLPLEGHKPILRDSDDYVHLIVIGMSRMGTALAIEAAHLAHYPNFNTRKRRSRITIIDDNMRHEKDFFMGRFRSLFDVAPQRFIDLDASTTIPEWYNPLTDPESKSPYRGNYLGEEFIDIEWEFVQGSIESPAVQQFIAAAANEQHVRLSIAVCIPDANKSLAAALYLPRTVFDSAIQILVNQRGGDRLVEQITQECYHNPFHNKLRPFGMARSGYDYSLVQFSEHIASQVKRDYEEASADSNGDIQRFTDKLIEMFDDTKAAERARDVVRQNMEQIRGDKDAVKLANETITDLLGERARICLDCNLQSIGKTEAAKSWSSIYNSNMMWTKLRSAGKINGELSEQQVWDLAIVEHNRWNMEQLLMTYRPLTREEQFAVYNSQNDEVKEVFKGRMAHYNICSWEMLTALDNTLKIDVYYAKKLIDYLATAESKEAKSAAPNK